MDKLLAGRFDAAHLKRRLSLQQQRSRSWDGQANSYSVSRGKRMLVSLLRLFGLYERGRRNFLTPALVRCEWILPSLPAAFNGFRMLQLSDLHADFEPELAQKAAALTAGLEYDICVHTGDFYSGGTDGLGLAMEVIADMLGKIKGPHFGVLGNHDLIQKVSHLESMGMRMLVNENIALQRGGQDIWLCGVDDSHHYRMADLLAARRNVPAKAFSILLSHSPDIHLQAAAAGFDLMLAGHTHGGQICLPGGIPLITHCRISRAYGRGRWLSGHLQGYTARGTGGCGLPVRFNCPAEITLHTLRTSELSEIDNLSI